MSKRKQKQEQQRIALTDLASDAQLLFREVEDQTDRGAAIAAATYLEEILAVMLKAYLLDGKDLQQRLFEFNGPLGTFAGRIDMAYSLGLIGPDMHHNLHKFKQIRNLFAHYYRVDHLEHEHIKEFCDDLKTVVPPPRGYCYSTRERFNTIFTTLAAQLLVRSHEVKRVTEGKDFVLGGYTVFGWSPEESSGTSEEQSNG